jgi:hypothetical protein
MVFKRYFVFWKFSSLQLKFAFNMAVNLAHHMLTGCNVIIENNYKEILLKLSLPNEDTQAHIKFHAFPHTGQCIG